MIQTLKLKDLQNANKIECNIQSHKLKIISNIFFKSYTIQSKMLKKN